MARRDTGAARARSVEVADLGDRQDLRGEPEVFEPALLERVVAGAELRLLRPAELALDVLHELLDARRRADGLLALELGRASLFSW